MKRCMPIRSKRQLSQVDISKHAKSFWKFILDEGLEKYLVQLNYLPPRQPEKFDADLANLDRVWRQSPRKLLS